jgi:hypothetical protein
MPQASTRTLVTFLLDRTGSMEAIRDDTIGGFNAYLDGLKGDGEAYIEFTLIQFDSVSIDKICVAVPIAKVDKLTRETYQPRASTPLIDAAVKTINAVEASLRHDPAAKVVVCIQTDGQENSSVEHNWGELNALIKGEVGQGLAVQLHGRRHRRLRPGRPHGHRLRRDRRLRPSRPGGGACRLRRQRAKHETLRRRCPPTTAYAPEEKAAAGDRFGNVVRKATRQLKKAIVDDITL